jgi:hypothetical protein
VTDLRPRSAPSWPVNVALLSAFQRSPIDFLGLMVTGGTQVSRNVAALVKVPTPRRRTLSGPSTSHASFLRTRVMRTILITSPMCSCWFWVSGAEGPLRRAAKEVPAFQFHKTALAAVGRLGERGLTFCWRSRDGVAALPLLHSRQ